MTRTTISKLSKEYAEAVIRYRRRRIEIEREMNQLKAELDWLRAPSWIEMVAKRVAKEMQEEFPDRHFEILGPFGMNNEVSIHFYKNGVAEKDKFKNENCLSITFAPKLDLDDGSFELAIVDAETNTHEFSEDTIAALNGANHPRIPILSSLEARQLCEIIKDRKSAESYKLLATLSERR